MVKDFWSILPTEFIDKKEFNISNNQLVLIHLVENDNFYMKKCLEWKKLGNTLIADNGFYELKGNMRTEELVKRANLIQADMLVFPDTAMKINFKFILQKGIKKIRELGYKGKIAGLVYADNQSFVKDMEQFKILNDVKEIDLICIPYAFNKDFEMRRPDFLKLVDNEIKNNDLKINKNVHLFGMNSLKNLEKEIKYNWVSSVDSTICFKMGYYRKLLSLKEDEDIKRPKNYFEINKLNEEQKNCIIYNLGFMKEMLK